jgi:hypothetical protein
MKVPNGGAEWRKSSYSMSDGQCVEVTAAKGMLAVRHSKLTEGRILIFSAQVWRVFLTAIKEGHGWEGDRQA